MSTVHKIEGKLLCTGMLTSRGVRPITQTDIGQIQDMCDSMSRKALRVLGFAVKTLKQLPENEEENIEFDMTFIGVTGMIDPPRKEVAESVRTCRNAGIRTIMITGDHKVTALAIAKELSIWQEGDTVISGEDLSAMSGEELDQAVKHATVFASEVCYVRPDWIRVRKTSPNMPIWQVLLFHLLLRDMIK